MLREEEKIIDVRLAALAAAVGKKRIGILQIRGTELVDRHRTALLQEETPIGFRLKEFKDRSGRLRTVPVLRLDQEHRLAVFKQFDRTVQDAQFVPFHVDFYEGNVLMDKRVWPRRGHAYRIHALARCPEPGLEGSKAVNRLLVVLRNE